MRPGQERILPTVGTGSPASGLRLLNDEVGRASPERTAPSMVAGSPVAVQSPARSRLTTGSRRRSPGDLLRGLGEGGAPLLDDPHRRLRLRGQPERARGVRPQPRRDRLARLVGQRVGGAHRQADQLVAHEQPLAVPPTSPSSTEPRGSLPAGQAEVAVDDRRGSRGTDVRQQRPGLPGRQRQDQAVARPELDPALPEVQGMRAASSKPMARRRCPKPTATPRCCEKPQRGIDQACREAVARDQRPAAGGALREALPQRRPEQLGGAWSAAC